MVSDTTEETTTEEIVSWQLLHIHGGVDPEMHPPCATYDEVVDAARQLHTPDNLDGLFAVAIVRDGNGLRAHTESFTNHQLDPGELTGR